MVFSVERFAYEIRWRNFRKHLKFCGELPISDDPECKLAISPASTFTRPVDSVADNRIVDALMREIFFIVGVVIEFIILLCKNSRVFDRKLLLLNKLTSFDIVLSRFKAGVDVGSCQ